MILERAIRALSFTEGFWKDAQSSPNNEAFGLNYGGGGIAYTGMSVSHESAMTMSAVYACVGLISEDIAAMPIDKFQRYPSARYSRPPSSWMRRPNTDMEWEDLIQQTVAAILMDGNGYLYPINDRTGRVAELWPLDPRTVDVVKPDGKLTYVVGRTPLPAKRIIHIRGVTLPGALKGLSVISAAKQSIGLGLGAEKMAGTLFGNGSTLNVVLQTEAGLTKDQAEAMRDRWNETHRGLDNAHSVTVLDRGAKAERLAMTNDEAQFIQTRGFQVEDVARWFHVPPHMIGATEKQTSWGTGVEQQHIGYVIHALTPRIKRIETVLNRIIEADDGPDFYCKFNVNGLLRGDMAARKDFYESMVRIGAYSPNNVLAKEDENPVPGLDGHYMQLAQGLIGPDGRLESPDTGGRPNEPDGGAV